MQYKRTAYLSNDTEKGIHYQDDKLTTSIPDGIYTLSLKIPKDTPLVGAIDVGYYIETRTRQGKLLLMAITEMDEDSKYKNIYCVDSSILVVNNFIEAIEEPSTAEQAEYYVKHALKNSDVELKVVESTEAKLVRFGSEQRVLARLQAIAEEFDLELSFDTEFTPGQPPKRYVSLLNKRVEDYEGFRISSDDFLLGVERKKSIINIATKMRVRGKTITPDTGTTISESTVSNPLSQPQATQYDSSKTSGATAISTSGWSASEVNQFRMDAADPPYINGAYIDAFLRKYYSDSPLIGAGTIIKEYADYFGVSVGAAMGVWAKESTFGRGEPGKSHYNYGCIRWSSGSGFPSVIYAGSAWNDYPNQRTGIAAWFKLLRYNYIDTGQARYDAFLDKYSPAFENDQSTFKNLMWGTLKAFGYNMSATTTKKNYSKSTDSVIDLVVPKTTVTTPTVEPVTNDFVETAIKKAFDIKALGRRYQWGGNGNPSWDCSGYMQECFKSAGKTIDHRWTTYTMWAQQGGHFNRISKNELQRGDMIMYDTGYTSSKPNHVGLYLGPTLSSPNSVIHAGDPVGLTQRADSMTVIGYVRVVK